MQWPESSSIEVAAGVNSREISPNRHFALHRLLKWWVVFAVYLFFFFFFLQKTTTTLITALLTDILLYIDCWNDGLFLLCISSFFYFFFIFLQKTTTTLITALLTDISLYIHCWNDGLFFLCISFFFFTKNNYNFNYSFITYITATTYSIVTSIALLLTFFVFYKYVLWR